MDQIFLTNLSARGVIGVYDWERDEPQEIRLNVTLFTDLRRAGQSDDVADSIDYHALGNRLLAYVAEARPLTVEALASVLARLCLEDPRVERVRLRVEKPAAVRFAQSVGVEIERTRQDL
jgi:FolB domain-containing protein